MQQTAMNAQAYRALTPREVATATQRGARALFPNYQILGLDATRTPSYVVGQNGERTIATTQVLIVLGRHARASFVAQEVMGPVAPVQVGETGWQIIFPPVHGAGVRRLAEPALSPALHAEVAVWLAAYGGAAHFSAAWPFPAGALVVASVHGQAVAALFTASESGPQIIQTLPHLLQPTPSGG